VIRFERVHGILWEGVLQRAVLERRVLVDAANVVYMYGHWPVIIGAGVLLFHYRPDQYARLRDACLLSGLVGLVVFSLFPVAPPRLTDLPLVDTVTRDESGYRQIVPPTMVNQYAAMPSFHAGWNLLAGIVVFSATRHWMLRTLAVLGPVAMMLAVVATANHYVLDVIAGASIVLICLVARDLVHARRTRRPRIERCGERNVPRRAPGWERARATPAGRVTRHPAHRG
jgi:membrane-associated phospholipid phosphatase